MRAHHLPPLRPAGFGRTAGAPWGWAAAGAALGLALGLLLFAPAHWLAQALSQATGTQLQLLQTRGTLWTGSAQLVLAAGPGSPERTALPGRVSWRVRPGLQGLQLRLTAPCCLPQDWVWTVHPSLSGIQLTFSDLPAALPARWPSSLLAGLGTPWNTLQLQGSLELSSQQLVARWQEGHWTLTGQARLDATQMSSSLSPLRPVGSYRLTLSGGSTPSLQLDTREGSSLQLRGNGHWTDGRLKFEGEASALPERRDALDNLLNIMGRRDGARALITVG